MNLIAKSLFHFQDLSYRDFQARLIPTVDKDRIIGVRTPQLRAMAKRIKGTAEAASFLNTLPHSYFEEDNLHAFLVEAMPFEECLQHLESFLPYVNNWATCDQMRPRCFSKNKAALLPHIRLWLTDSHPYTVRFGIAMLMNLYLDGDFSPEYPRWVSEIQSEEYYVNMMAAWYFATALAKQYDNILPYFQDRLLSQWIHNKAIQKAVESSRITLEQKETLKALRWK